MESPFDRPIRAPLGIGALIDLAIAAYAARWRLYLAAAALDFAVVGCVTLLANGDANAFACAAIAGDALLAAIVAVGVAGFFRCERWPSERIMRRAGERFLAVLLVDLAVLPLQLLALWTVVAAATGAVLFALPALVLWGTFSISDAIAAVESDPTPTLVLVPFALRRSIELGWRRRNLGRVFALAAMQIPVWLLGAVVQDLLGARHVAAAAFWSQAPISALLTGPFEALFVAFYFDLLARERTSAASSPPR